MLLASILGLGLISQEPPTASTTLVGSTYLGGSGTNVVTNVVVDALVQQTTWASGTNRNIYRITGTGAWLGMTGEITGESSTNTTAVLTRGRELRGYQTVLSFPQVISAGTNSTIVGWTNTSLNYMARTNLTALMEASSPTWANVLMTSSSTTTNPNFWLRSVLDLRAVPLSTSFGNTGSGILISPYHLVTASHVTAPTNSRWRFLNTNGALVEVTNAKSAQILGGWPTCDVVVHCFSSPVTHIRPAAIASMNFTNIGNVSGSLNALPVIYVNQDRAAMLTELADPSSYSGVPSMARRPPTWSSEWGQWTWETPASQVRNGDSGTPYFILAKNRIAVVATWTFRTHGRILGALTNELQSAMNTLSTDTGTPPQTLEVLNLETYSP